MTITRYLAASVDLSSLKPAIATIPPSPAPAPRLPLPPPVASLSDAGKRTWRYDEILAVAIDEIRKNKNNWPWLTGINGYEIYELGKMVANALDKSIKSDNARNRKLGLGPIKFSEGVMRGFMPAQSRSYAPLAIKKNGGIFIRVRDGFYSGYPQPQVGEELT